MKRITMLSVVVFGLAIAGPQVVKAGTGVAQTQASEVMQQDVTYQQVAVDELPEAVAKAFAKGYEGYTISKAYKGSDGSYKLEAVGAEVTVELYYSETGELIKSE